MATPPEHESAQPPRWEFRLLGPLEVLAGGVPVAIAGTRQRAVLAILLLDVNHVVPTDRLIDRLWGDVPPPTATTSLHNGIAQLRKALGAERLETRPPGYVIHLDAGELDLARFEDTVGRAASAGTAERARLLGEALALWRGTPLADFAFEPWAEAEIQRLEEQRLRALEERIGADLELGRHAEVVGELEALAAEHPLRERLRGRLMLALYRSGRQADALAEYRSTRRALTDELGIEPTPTLQRLHAAILRQATELDSAPQLPVGDAVEEAARALVGGRLVLVLGAGVHGSDNGRTLRPADVARHLARSFDYPLSDRPELAHVAQFVAVTHGTGPLYDQLHELLAAEHPLGPVHEGVVAAVAALRARDAPQPVIVTTNYDHALERALRSAAEPFDQLTYIAAGRDRGKFEHTTAGGETQVVDLPNAYGAVPVGERLVVLKVHGQVDPDRDREGFVVSEDDYISYLAQTEITNVIPVTVAAKLRRSHFLFLGYGLRDWTLRVFLQRVWPDDRPSYRSWAVDPESADRDFWRHRGIDLVEGDPAAYLERLTALVRDG
jgi:DNA-binding SARP family transcriptional activator